MNRVLVAPSILSGDFGNMTQTVQEVEQWGADYVHCDVMDGVYVKNITFGMPMIKAIKKGTSLPLDVHLMITKPEKYVVQFVESGADIVTFHPEASENPSLCIDLIKGAGAKAGIVFNPDVDIDSFSYLFDKCDLVLVMSVFAGLGGQKFIDYCVDRTKKVKSLLNEKNLDIPIEVDGGINEETAKKMVEAGARILVAGNAVFKSENPECVIKNLRGTK